MGIHKAILNAEERELGKKNIKIGLYIDSVISSGVKTPTKS